MQVKQSWQLNDKTFIATSNARNEHMLKEAGDFANHLKHCERDIRLLKNATEGNKISAFCVLFMHYPSSPAWEFSWNPYGMVATLLALGHTLYVIGGAGLLMTTKTIMAAPLPRVFEESAGGKAVPVPTAPGQNGNIGGDFRADELVRVSKDTVTSNLPGWI